jgi:flagellar L-ring protein precursor FlgH
MTQAAIRNLPSRPGVRLALALAALLVPAFAARAAERRSAKRTAELRGEDSRWGKRNPISDREIRVHDLVTIVIKESSNTSSTLETEYSKDTELTLEIPKAFSVKSDKGSTTYEPLTASSKRPELDISHGRKTEGKGDLQHKEKFEARVTAEVIEIMPNGDLVLEARKRVTMGEDQSELILTGRIRPGDVRSDNTVESDRVADSHIVYRPKGAAADANKRGWLHRLFDFVNIF